MQSRVSHKVAAWLPLRTTVFEDDECAAAVDAGIREFLVELPAALPVVFAEISDVKVEAREPPVEVASYISWNSSVLAPPLFQCVCVSAFVSFASREADYVDAEQERMVELSDAAYYLGRALDIAIDLSELASPGCVWVAEGAVVVDGLYYAHTSEKRFFNALHPRAEFPTSWPPVRMLSILSTIQWGKSIGMLDAPLASSRIQRALAAYTNLVGLTTTGDNEPLFRAMQALEAFYCDGAGDLRRQLAEKARLWLGDHETATNVIGHLYDLRSKYVHGAAKLQYRHDTSDPWEHDLRTMTQLSTGTSFATRLLVATLQRCIENGVAELSWSYAVHCTSGDA